MRVGVRRPVGAWVFRAGCGAGASPGSPRSAMPVGADWMSDRTIPRRGGHEGDGKPRLALPGDLPKSLQYLDDGQLDELMRAGLAEARRRGWRVGTTMPVHPGGVAKSRRWRRFAVDIL